MQKNNPDRMRTILIEREPIELYKILKIDNMVTSGGEAKGIIAAGLVRVNGEIETRKRKKIMGGDIIEYNGERIKIIIDNRCRK